MTRPPLITHDPGLRAVARVRGVREQDSRLGLRQALAEHHTSEGRLARLDEQRDRTPALVESSVTEFLATRQSLTVLADALRAARADVASRAVVAAEARGRWQHDRTRLEAVEMLLERRAAARRAESDRREARELDDLAAQRWQRRRVGRGGGS
ncbi:flagellar export protein FliJ [Nocardioides sp.]|uniref:flagellar export protein FliJ n=1 Tax=Nocardioides sp. TaxID=35761 RepID=UPI002735CA72|nr:flagellar export protein FliJ [Nocardioides sp.]MDP3890245.1 flagellar export protein FliJ [Nocardioides sp.]